MNYNLPEVAVMLICLDKNGRFAIDYWLLAVYLGKQVDRNRSS